MARGLNLFSRVQLVTGLTDTTITPSLIYETLNDYQTKIAEKTLCLEGYVDITIDANGVAPEPSDFYRLKRVKLPTNTYLFPEEVDVAQFDFLQHVYFTSIGTRTYYYKRWNGSLTFLPNPSNQTWQIYYYRVPATSIASGVAPELPTYMDDCIRYGTLSELLSYKSDDASLKQSMFFKARYDEELQKNVDRWRATKTNDNFVLYHDLG